MLTRSLLPILLILSLLLAPGCSSYPMKQNVQNPLPECPNTPNCKRVSVSIEADSMTTMKALNDALVGMGAETITLNTDSIHAVFRIPVFGWKDDLNILVQPEDNFTTVFIRSASRDGHWDIWANAIRVNKLLKRTKKQLSD